MAVALRSKALVRPGEAFQQPGAEKPGAAGDEERGRCASSSQRPAVWAQHVVEILGEGVGHGSFSCWRSRSQQLAERAKDSIM